MSQHDHTEIKEILHEQFKILDCLVSRQVNLLKIVLLSLVILIMTCSSYFYFEFVIEDHCIFCNENSEVLE